MPALTRGAMAVAILILPLVGCGGGYGGSRVAISGTVTFGNGPVPAGRVYFDPVAGKNASGQQGYAEIRDGKFDTADGGRGPSPGTVRVRIDGIGEATPHYPGGKPLFMDFSPSELTLTDATSTQEFKVPITAAAKLPDNPGPPP